MDDVDDEGDLETFRAINQQGRLRTDDKARRHLPALKESAHRLLDLTREVLRSRFRFAKSDDLAFMVLSFAPRQAEYLRSICTLVDAGDHNAAGLVARTMVEGMCLLVYAAQRADTVPTRWRAYAAVENLELLKRRERDGELIDPVLRSHIEAQLRDHGSQFHNRKAKNCERAGEPLPANPFQQNWYGGIPIRDVFKSVRAEKLYDWIYWHTSQLIHWTIAGLAKDIGSDGDEFSYTTESPVMSATALAAGFQSLHESLSVLEIHLNLGFRDRLEELRQDHLAIQRS